jgi:hypothetical protein
MKRIFLFAVSSLVFGCATPPAFVSASPVSQHQIERFRNLDCDQLNTEVGTLVFLEMQMADEMSGRAVKQGLLNVLAVGTLATTGVGFAVSARGESDRRTQLANTRSELEALRFVMKEKTCQTPNAANATK